MNFSEIVDTNLENFFWDIINSRAAYLRNVDDKYKELYAEILDITTETELRDFFGEKKIKSLSEDDAEIILRYLQLIEDKHVLELKDAFYSAFAISKDIDDRLEKIRSDIEWCVAFYYTFLKGGITMNEYVITITSQSSNSYLINASTKEDAISKAIEFYNEEDEYRFSDDIVNISIDVELLDEDED